MNPSSHILTRIGAGLATAGAALLLAASPAAADSIAYVKDGNLWLSTPDGARQYQVTTDGGYSAVTQADSGRMVGLRGTRLRYLERDGTLLADILTPVSDPVTDGSKQFYGPYDPAISPDGTKVAYDYYFQYTGYDPYCNPSTNCYTKQLYQGTGFTRPYELTGWDEEAFKRQSGWVDPSWVGEENEVMISNPSQPLNEDVVLYSPGTYGAGGGEGNFLRWFHDPASDLSDGEMTRDELKMAFVEDDGKRITIWRGKGGYPQIPNACYAISGKGKLSSPTWSHDGTRVAWAEEEGVMAIAMPDLSQDCGTPTERESRLLIPGASNPDWGPADVPPARPVVQQPGDGGAKPGPGDGGAKPGPGDGGTKPADPRTGAPVTTIAPGPGEPAPAPTGKPAASKPTASVSVPKLRRALAKGLTVRIAGAEPGRHRLVLKAGRRTVGGATAAIASDGTGRAVVKFTPAGKRSLKRRAKVAVTLTGAGVTRKLVLKR